MRYRLRYAVFVVMVLAALSAPSVACATGSFLGTITADAILTEAVGVLPYFAPVILVVVGIGLAVWAINWLIAALKQATAGHQD